MPALRMLGRRWSVATDDVPVLAVVPTLFHGIWACGLGIGWCVLGRPDGCHEGAGYSVVVAGLFFCFTANFVLGAWLCYEGLKGAPAARVRPTSYCVVGHHLPSRPAAGSPQRLCASRLPLRHAPAAARALHPVLAAHGAGRGNMHQLCALPPENLAAAAACDVLWAHAHCAHSQRGLLCCAVATSAVEPAKLCAARRGQAMGRT